jgi:dimethylargininase
MLAAITRAVSPCIGDCQLTFISREAIDFSKAVRQLQAYEACLSRLGVKLVSLPPEARLPDAVFVEDTAVVVDEIALIPRMGLEKRQSETRSSAALLSRFRPLTFLNRQTTLEGGDVMRIDRTLYAGASGRTNRDGIAELAKVLARYDYQVRSVAVNKCLHLKTGCSYLGRGTILANRGWIDAEALNDFEIIDVPPTEPWAANVLLIDDVVVLPTYFPETRALLEARGFRVCTTDISEFQKAEGGLTCLSIIFKDV